MRFLLPLLFSLGAAAASADVIVSDFQGAADQYRAQKQGEKATLERNMLLQAGDKVRVLSEEGRLTLRDFQGRTKVLRGSGAEYVVPETASPSWLDNALRGLLAWREGLAASASKGVITTTRGEDDPPRLLGMVRGENLVPNTLETIRLHWDGGSPPYRLEIAGDDRVAWSMTAKSGPLEVPSQALTEERYRVRVSSRRCGSEIRDSGEFFLVPVDELPGRARAILSTPLPPATKSLLVSLALATHPEWRFAALQYAIDAEDAELVAALLAGRSPVGD